MDEQLDIIDESGRKLYATGKTKAHQGGLLHSCVIGYLRNGSTWTLVKQTPDRQDAGQLVAPVGGHVRANETPIAALLRESEEEIGTPKIVYREIGRARFHRQVIGRDENHLFIVYEISTSEPLQLGDEAESLEIFTDTSLKQALHDTPERFGDALYFTFEQFYHQYLPPTWVNRWR
jgi:8-oxo-dGTP pyrophosphatase MutT (NUDIX family)